MNASESRNSVILGVQLKKARELLQLKPEEAAHEMNVSLQDLFSWEEERTRPTLTQLEELARLYGREIDYFLRETPDPPTHIEFRGKPGLSLVQLPKETKMVLARFDELCRTAFEFEILLNKKREVKLPKVARSDPPKTAAQSLRKQFNVGDKPLPNLRDRLEDEGVRIFELPVSEDIFSGFSFWHAKYGPCILLNANELTGRRNFSLAHELGHLIYNHGSSLCYIPAKFGEIAEVLENNTNQVAIELLLPESGIVEDFKKRHLSRTPSVKDLAPIAYSKWGVSIQALGYRLENLHLIEKGHIDNLFEIKPHIRGKKGPRTPTWEKRLGKRFIENSFEAYQRGIISIGRLSQSLGITIRQAIEKIEQKSK